MAKTDIQYLTNLVNQVFQKNFGRTPLRQRLEDIFQEALELSRFTDMANLKEEAGDTMASLLALFAECGWDPSEAVKRTLTKIEHRQLQYKSLGRKYNVAILGGAFNPITEGHIKMAQFVLDTSKTFDEVWLCPCYQHLYGKEMESPEDRLAMCRLAAEVDGRIKVFDYEIRNQLAGETYYFVKRLLDEDFAKDQHDFSMIIGQDNANSFTDWVNYKDLEKMMRFVIVPRKGISPASSVDWYLKPPHIFLSPDNQVPEISSTEIRSALRILSFEDFYRKYVRKGDFNKNVQEYILEHNLYGVQS